MLKNKNFVLFSFLIYVLCLFKSVENTAECTKKHLTGNETQDIELKKCSVFFYENEIISDKSISRIILSNTPLNETFNGAFALVTIEEYREKEGKYVTPFDMPWIIYSNETFKKNHFSQSMKIKITFSTREDWSNSVVKLRYEEVKPETYVKHSSNLTEKEISPWVFDDWYYRPNSNYTFIIDKNKSLSISTIRITLHELDIDKDIGEYLLIGAGSYVFEGPPPLCILGPPPSCKGKAIGKKIYSVEDETAYIVLITNATRKNYKGFNISWEYEGTAIEEPKIDDKEDVRKSAPICIYNISAANEEFRKSGDYFSEFRQNFAKVATEYAKNTSGIPDSTTDDIISASSVSVFRISGTFKDEQSHQALYAMVKITKDSLEGKAAFERREDLEEIISIYSRRASSKDIDDKFEFRTCGAPYVPESWFYFGLILLIPVISFALLLWIWKQNPIAEHYEKKRKLKRASITRRSQQGQSLSTKYYDVDNCDFAVPPATENPYTTLPKVQVTNELGRRTTLNLSDALLYGDNGSDDELFNKYFADKRRSDVLELQRMQRTNRLFFTNQGEDNAAFEMDLGNSAATEQRQQDDRAEHTYESVRSSASLIESTRL